MSRPLALVTGSWRRLGAHIAARLGEDGYDVALHAAHEVQAEDWLIARLERAGAAHRLFVADLADGAAVAGLPRSVSAHFGRPIDLLVNNASRFAVIADDTVAPFEDAMLHFAVNVAAPYALAMAMTAGAVINILDQRIVNPPRDQLAYTVSKQGLGEATRTLATALAPAVRVNGVAPGLTIPTGDYAADQLARLAAAMPLGRLPEPDEIADAILYLARARSVTGGVIFVDGGASRTGFDRDFAFL